GREVALVEDAVEAHGVGLGGAVVRLAVQVRAVGRGELGDATGGQDRVEHGHALAVRDGHRRAHRAGHAYARQVLVAAQVGEDHGDLRVADVGGQFFLDIGGHLRRRVAAGRDVADQRHGNLAVRPHGHGDAQFRVAPDGYLHDVVDADQVV